MPRFLSASVLCMTFVASVNAAAQPAPAGSVSVTRVTPSEVGLSMGVWDLMGTPVSLGGRVTRTHRDWLAAEFSFDGRRGSSLSQGSVLAVVNARFMFHDTAARRNVFASVGVVAGRGLSYALSPMVGVGVQTEWSGAVALRAEFQRFTAGRRPLEDRGRLLFSLVVRIP